jgi:hypothetical protein
MGFRKSFIFFLLFWLASVQLVAQTKVRGTVTDADTGEPLPFVNVSVKGTSVGVITDMEGAYFIETKVKADSIVFSYVGYHKEAFAVQENRFQEINIGMYSLSLQLEEVVILPGENPAHVLLRKIDENRSRNNPDRFETYQYEVYNKMEIDLSNIDDNFKESRLFNQFQFVFDYID